MMSLAQPPLLAKWILPFALAATVTILWSSGGFVTLLNTGSGVNIPTQNQNFIFEPSMSSDGGGIYVATWFEVRKEVNNSNEEPVNPRSRLSSNYQGQTTWGTPQTVINPTHFRGSLEWTFSTVDPYLTFDPVRNRFLHVSMNMFGHEVWLAYTDPNGLWRLNGVTSQGGVVSLAPGSQPFAGIPLRPAQDYPSVAVNGSGQIMIAVWDIVTRKYYYSVSTSVAPDGTTYFTAPAEVPTLRDLNPFPGSYWGPSFRVAGAYSKFLLFASIYSGPQRPWAIDKYEFSGGIWSPPIGIASFTSPDHLSGQYFCGSSGGCYQIFEPVSLDVRASIGTDNWLLAWPVRNGSYNNIYNCNKYGCAIMSPQARDQFLPGASISSSGDGWLTFFEYSSTPGLIDQKAMYAFPNGVWTPVATIKAGLTPSVWVNWNNRCQPAANCWMAGDYFQNASNLGRFATALYPDYHGNPPHPYVIQRLFSSLLQEPPVTNLPQEYVAPLRFPLGTDLRKVLPKGPKVAPTTIDRPDAYRWQVRQELVRVCPADGPVPLTEKPICKD